MISRVVGEKVDKKVQQAQAQAQQLPLPLPAPTPVAGMAGVALPPHANLNPGKLWSALN
jgi:hypothetical protein